MIADDIRLSRALADACRGTPELELHDAGAEHHDVPLRAGRPPAAARRAGVESYLERAQPGDCSTALQRGGEAFVSNAVVDGRYVLRACIVNFHTTRADVEALPAIVVRVGREIHAGRTLSC